MCCLSLNFLEDRIGCLTFQAKLKIVDNENEYNMREMRLHGQCTVFELEITYCKVNKGVLSCLLKE